MDDSDSYARDSRGQVKVPNHGILVEGGEEDKNNGSKIEHSYCNWV